MNTTWEMRKYEEITKKNVDKIKKKGEEQGNARKQKL